MPEKHWRLHQNKMDRSENFGVQLERVILVVIQNSWANPNLSAEDKHVGCLYTYDGHDATRPRQHIGSPF